MEKLKAKHDHKLTDILKVAIFGLMLILPGLILLPSMLYYGVNEHATAPTEQVEKIEYERVDFNQKAGNFENRDIVLSDVDVKIQNSNFIILDGTSSSSPSDTLIQLYEAEIGHKYIISGCFVQVYDNTLSWVANVNQPLSTTWNTRVLYNFTTGSYLALQVFIVENTTYNHSIYYPQIFDLTQMFGSGNEPTLQEFNSWYTSEYYEYTASRYEILEKPTGTYETYTNITSQIQFNWNSLWQQPLFSWTNYTILKQGLDNFTYVFGITQTSYINNLITYELIMVAIYIVIDIVLTLFKWLTHLIGEK